MKNQPRFQRNNQASGGAGRRPVHEVRFGTIQAAIWENQNQNGTWHSVTFNRSYKDGEEWRHTDSFNRDDLLLVAKAADLAHTWICEQRHAAAEANQ